jgi:histidine triad (HIT) family protein
MSSSFWEPCWACRLVAGEPCGHIVYDTPEVIVALNPFAIHAGHALVMPRQHVRNIYELPDALAGPILVTAAGIARAVKRAFRADGITLRQNNDPAGDQHLFHVHWHVIPRVFGDAERFCAAAPLSDDASLADAASVLRAELRLAGLTPPSSHSAT